MADREGNVLLPPGLTTKPEVKGDEILSSYARFTQRGCTLKTSQGVLAAGTLLAKDSTTRKYIKYTGSGTSTNEVQSVTEGGSGLTSFTLTFSGQTTVSVAAAATAATLQTALENLSNIGPGNVVVTGNAGGPYTVTFQGTLAGSNVAQMTSTPTGGTGTVTVATVTAGTSGSALGFLRNAVDTDSGDRLGNIVISGIVKLSVVAAANGAPALDTDAVSDLNGRIDIFADQFIF